MVSINYLLLHEFIQSNEFLSYSIEVQKLLSALTELLNHTTIEYLIKVRKDSSIVISSKKDREKNIATVNIYQRHIRLKILNHLDIKIDSIDQLDNRITETILEKYQSIFSAKKQISVYLDTNLIEILEEKSKFENRKLNDVIIDSIVQTNNCPTLLNNLNDKLFKKLQYAMMADEKSASELIEISLNQYFFEPFVNELHIKNYLFLLGKFKAERIKFSNDRNSSKKNPQVDITLKETALLYLLSFDDLVMDYVVDGKFISFEEGITIQIPSELYSLLWHTFENYLYIVLESYANYTLEIDESSTGGFDFIDTLSSQGSRVEDLKVLSIGKIIENGRLHLRTPDWYREILKYSQPKETYNFNILNFDEFLDSETFKAYSSNIKRMLYSLINKFIEYKMIDCVIYQREYNVLSFRPKDKPDERLCVITIYSTYIRLSITYSNDDYYHYNLDLDGQDEDIVQTLIKRYNLSPPKPYTYDGLALV